MNHEDVMEILTKYTTVAIVGISRSPSKDNYNVANYLKKHDFYIVPINPFVDEILGEKCYKSLLDMSANVQKTVEIVDIFRPSDDVLPIVDQAVQLKKLYGVPNVIWMQLGIINKQAAETAGKAGLTVIMDRCMMQEHQRLFAESKSTR